MAYGSKYRKKRGKKRKAKGLGRIGLAKITNKQGTYLYENRTPSLHSTPNHNGFFILGAAVDAVQDTQMLINDKHNLQNILDASGVSALGDSNANTDISYHISNHKVAYRIKNCELEACILRVYEVECVDDLIVQGYTVAAGGGSFVRAYQFMINQLVKGWDHFSQASNVNSSTGDGQYVDWIQGNSSDNEVIDASAANGMAFSYSFTVSDQLSPFNSVGFKRFFKINRWCIKKLESGEDWVIAMKGKNNTYNPSDYMATANETADLNYGNSHILAKPGAKCLMVFCHGVMGVTDTEAAAVPNNATIHGWMTTNCSVEIIERAKVLKLEDGQRSFSYAIETDTLSSTEALVGVSHGQDWGDDTEHD